VQLVLAHAYESLPGQAPVPAHQRDAVVLEPGQLGGVVELVDGLVAAAQHGIGVQVAGDGLPHTRDASRLVEQLRRAQQRLGRHAGVERALAADEVRLDDRDGMATLGEPARDHLARRPGTDHDDIELALLHGPCSVWAAGWTGDRRRPVRASETPGYNPPPSRM